MERLISASALDRRARCTPSLSETARAFEDVMAGLRNIGLNKPKSIAEQRCFFDKFLVGRTWILDLSDFDCHCDRLADEVLAWESVPFEMSHGSFTETSGRCKLEGGERKRGRCKRLALFSATSVYPVTGMTELNTGETKGVFHVAFLVNPDANSLTPVLATANIPLYKQFQNDIRDRCCFSRRDHRQHDQDRQGDQAYARDDHDRHHRQGDHRHAREDQAHRHHRHHRHHRQGDLSQAHRHHRQGDYRQVHRHRQGDYRLAQRHRDD